MGLALFAAVPGPRALDVLQAGGGAGRRRALVTAAAFVLAAAGTRYAVAPWLWSDPFAVVDAFKTMARHPTHAHTLFQGEVVHWPSIPPRYLPTWVAVTTPPAALLLALAGAAAVVWRGAARSRDALRNTGLRFEWKSLTAWARKTSRTRLPCHCTKGAERPAESAANWRARWGNRIRSDSRLFSIVYREHVAEGLGFEPRRRFRAQRFSRPPPSTARPSLRGGARPLSSYSVGGRRGHAVDGFPRRNCGSAREKC